LYNTAELVAFITALNIVLYQPQMRHLLQMVDALLVSNETKTISGLYRLLKGQPDPKAGADFLRESPWEPNDVSSPRKRWMVNKFLELASKLDIGFDILISIDDSLGKKGKATKHLDAVDIQHNHNESSRKKQAYTNGYVYVEVHLQIGPIGFLFDTRLYLREKTVRCLNRERSPGQRLRYRTKYLLAREMLVELTELLPKGHKVYVLFDSWYSSAKLIKFCRRQKWQVVWPSNPTGGSTKYVLTNITWRSGTSIMSKSRSKLWTRNTKHPSITPAWSKATWKIFHNPSMRSSRTPALAGGARENVPGISSPSTLFAQT
jgi:hypothetical protein